MSCKLHAPIELPPRTELLTLIGSTLGVLHSRHRVVYALTNEMGRKSRMLPNEDLKGESHDEG